MGGKLSEKWPKVRLVSLIRLFVEPEMLILLIRERPVFTFVSYSARC